MTRKPNPPAIPLIDAVRVASPDIAADGFTYTVLIHADPQPSPPPVAGERRRAPRRRTRLRSAKIIDARGRFITDCLVQDLSATGVRLRLPEAFSLPATFQIYDDQSELLHNAVLSWQRAGEAGVRFETVADQPRDHVVAADMRRKYYKLPR